MEVNALQILRNHIATSREEAYELLSHIRIHDAQPIVFRFRYQNPKTGQEQTRALLAIGYNDKAWGRTTNKIIWDDVLIEEQINDLYENIKRLDKRIDDEIERATKAEEHLQDEIDDLDDRLEKEIKRATETEADIDKRLREEIKRSTDFDNDLDTRLKKEIADARAGEARATTVVQLNGEKDTVEHLRLVHTTDGTDGHNIYTLGLVDVASQTDLNTTNTNLNNEITRAKNEEKRIEDKIDKEINDRQDAITAESQARQDADTELDNKIQAESQARQDADTALQTQINNINVTVTDHETRITVLEGRINNMDADITNIKNDITNINNTLAGMTIDINQLKIDVANALAKLVIKDPLREFLVIEADGFNYVVNGKLDATH